MTKRKSRKMSKRKSRKIVHGGNNTINPEDIKYQDHDVVILHPHVKKGVLIYHEYINSPGLDICKNGLKPDLQMYKKEILSKKVVNHDTIIFKAPKLLNEKHNYDTIETEYEGLFFKKEELYDKEHPIICIRVDPNNTYVYSSKIHDEAPQELKNDDLQKSKILLSEYLKIQNNNEIYIENFDKRPYNDRKDISLVYNLTTHKVSSIRESRIRYPHTVSLYFNGEILVHMGHMTSDYFVHCT